MPSIVRGPVLRPRSHKSSRPATSPSHPLSFLGQLHPFQPITLPAPTLVPFPRPADIYELRLRARNETRQNETHGQGYAIHLVISPTIRPSDPVYPNHPCQTAKDPPPHDAAATSQYPVHLTGRGREAGDSKEKLGEERRRNGAGASTSRRCRKRNLSTRGLGTKKLSLAHSLPVSST